MSSLFKVCCYEDVVIVDVQFCGVTQSASQLASMSRTQATMCLTRGPLTSKTRVEGSWSSDAEGEGERVRRCG